MKTNQIAPLGVRMPPELKDHLKEKASENRRSLNSEVVCRLEESVKAEQIAKPAEE
ncbi:Arc family DNA-binding protein [Paraburkholderia sp.]|jgi:predicted HicB family RNase H-like nuclease|uniref:Arc family DNA-binding protein n=1 Tax=Paraburkholderia sp. TaxID=1926495 RepID=UPI002F41F535